MKKKLEVVVWPVARKSMEFKQTLDCLADTLESYCSSLRIDKARDESTYTISAQWETVDHMRHALQSEEFLILFGAIAALCDKTMLKLDDKPAGNHISMIPSIIQEKKTVHNKLHNH